MSSGVERVEVLGPVQRRRRYSVDEKLRVLEEAAVPGMTISFVARRHGISPSLLFHWRRRMAEGGKEAVRADDAARSAGRSVLQLIVAATIAALAAWQAAGAAFNRIFGIYDNHDTAAPLLIPGSPHDA
jgi:transposase-like protein